MVGFCYCLFLSCLLSNVSSLLFTKKKFEVIHNGTTYSGTGEIIAQQTAVNVLTICVKNLQTVGKSRDRKLKMNTLLESLQSHIKQRRKFAEGHSIPEPTVAIFLQSSSEKFEKMQVLSAVDYTFLGLSAEDELTIPHERKQFLLGMYDEGKLTIPYQREEFVNLYLERGKLFVDIQTFLCLPDEDAAELKLSRGSKLIQISVKHWTEGREMDFRKLLSDTSVNGYVESVHSSSAAESDFRPATIALQCSIEREYLYVEFFFKELDGFAMTGAMEIPGYLKLGRSGLEIWFTEIITVHLNDGTRTSVTRNSSMLEKAPPSKVYLNNTNDSKGNGRKKSWKGIADTKITKLNYFGKPKMTILSFTVQPDIPSATPPMGPRGLHQSVNGAIDGVRQLVGPTC